MKKTLGLLGLFLTGLMLLANPTTGILAETDTDPAAAAAVTSTTLSGDPPTGSNEGDDVIVVETTTASEATTTTEVTTTTEESAVESTGPFSVVGSAEESRFGTFQVEVFFDDGEIVAVEAVQLPSDRKSDSINTQAVPAYEEAVIAAQSADIDVISGATVTWDNYSESLQSALDEVGFSA